jgi:integrase
VPFYYTRKTREKVGAFSTIIVGAFSLDIYNDLVFSTVDGKPLRPNTITRAWTVLAARAGLKVIRLHDARHTHASIMLKQGIHPKIVQERLGHSSIAITLDTYSHVSPGLQEAAAKRFDEAFTTKYNESAIESVR